AALQAQRRLRDGALHRGRGHAPRAGRGQRHLRPLSDPAPLPRPARARRPHRLQLGRPGRTVGARRDGGRVLVPDDVMARGRALANDLGTLDSLSVAVLTDDVSDNYVSKTPFAVSEFSNVVRGGAGVISGEALLCANLGYGLRLVSNAGGTRHTMLFDTGPEAAIYLRNCTNLGIPFGDVEAIAVTHGHWDHMAALPATIDRIIGQGGRVTVHVNPGMFN